MDQRDLHRRPREPQHLPRPDQVRERLREAVIARMLSLPDELQSSVRAELSAAAGSEDVVPAQIADDLTCLDILRRHAMVYEGRWRSYLSGVFNAWPQPPAAEIDQYALISEDQLQSQLVGQPVIEALDRRFSDILDVLDSRLWDFALRTSGRGESLSPVSPRVFVEGLLTVFPVNECSPSLRQALLRHYQVLAGDQLGDFYAWFNTELAEAGYTMSRPGRYAIQVASPVEVLADRNAVERGAGTSPSRRDRGAGGGEFGEALRQRLRIQRAHRAQHEPGRPESSRRVLGDQEFLAVLSLVQAEPDTAVALAGQRLAERLRDALVMGAAKLGLDPASAALSLPQEDAIDLVGTVLEALIEQREFDGTAQQLLAQMAFPYVHLVLVDPDLLDDTDDPAMRLLAELALLFDGTTAGSDLHAAGASACAEVINGYHGDAGVFPRTLEATRKRVMPMRLRAQVAARRAWQTLVGRERLEAARRNADAQLHAVYDARQLLPTVAGFLSEVWRQALVHVWLREGPQSAHYRSVLAIGQSVVQVDAQAAAGAGQAVAGQLLQLEASLRACYAACGLDEHAATNPIAELVAEVARPDAHRHQHRVDPLHAEPTATPDPAKRDASGLDTDQAFIYRAQGEAPQALRLVGISELSGRHMFAGGQGQLVLEADEVGRALASAQLLPRSADDPIDTVIRRLVSAT